MGVGEGKEIVRDREGQRVTIQRDREIDRETKREKEIREEKDRDRRRDRECV